MGSSGRGIKWYKSSPFCPEISDRVAVHSVGGGMLVRSYDLSRRTPGNGKGRSQQTEIKKFIINYSVSPVWISISKRRHGTRWWFIRDIITLLPRSWNQQSTNDWGISGKTSLTLKTNASLTLGRSKFATTQLGYYCGSRSISDIHSELALQTSPPPVWPRSLSESRVHHEF